MTTEIELLESLRGVFRDVAQTIVRESPACPARVEAVQKLLDAQIAAGVAARWSPPPPPAPSAPLVDDHARAERRAASDLPKRLR